MRSKDYRLPPSYYEQRELLKRGELVERYDPSASFIRSYDRYKADRLVAQDDKVKIFPNKLAFLPWYREVALKKCKRLLFKLKNIRTYQTLIESHEILSNALIEAEKRKPLYKLCQNENPINDDHESERTLAILRVIAGVIQTSYTKIEPYAYKLGKAKKVTISEKSYNLARKLKASLHEDGFDPLRWPSQLPFLSRLNAFLGVDPFSIDEVDSLESYEEVVKRHDRAGYQISPSMKYSTTRQLLIREATLLSRRYLRFKGKDRFPAEAIQSILKYIDGTDTDIRTIKRIQALYDPDIINEYYEMGEYDKAKPFYVYITKRLINPKTNEVVKG